MATSFHSQRPEVSEGMGRQQAHGATKHAENPTLGVTKGSGNGEDRLPGPLRPIGHSDDRLFLRHALLEVVPMAEVPPAKIPMRGVVRPKPSPGIQDEHAVVEKGKSVREVPQSPLHLRDLPRRHLLHGQRLGHERHVLNGTGQKLTHMMDARFGCAVKPP